MANVSDSVISLMLGLEIDDNEFKQAEKRINKLLTPSSGQVASAYAVLADTLEKSLGGVLGRVAGSITRLVGEVDLVLDRIRTNAAKPVTDMSGAVFGLSANDQIALAGAEHNKWLIERGVADPKGSMYSSMEKLQLAEANAQLGDASETNAIKLNEAFDLIARNGYREYEKYTGAGFTDFFYANSDKVSQFFSVGKLYQDLVALGNKQKEEGANPWDINNGALLKANTIASMFLTPDIAKIISTLWQNFHDTGTQAPDNILELIYGTSATVLTPDQLKIWQENDIKTFLKEQYQSTVDYKKELDKSIADMSLYNAKVTSELQDMANAIHGFAATVYKDTALYLTGHKDAIHNDASTIGERIAEAVYGATAINDGVSGKNLDVRAQAQKQTNAYWEGQGLNSLVTRVTADKLRGDAVAAEELVKVFDRNGAFPELQNFASFYDANKHTPDGNRRIAERAMAVYRAQGNDAKADAIQNALASSKLNVADDPANDKLYALLRKARNKDLKVGDTQAIALMLDLLTKDGDNDKLYAVNAYGSIDWNLAAKQLEEEGILPRDAINEWLTALMLRGARNDELISEMRPYKDAVTKGEFTTQYVKDTEVGTVYIDVTIAGKQLRVFEQNVSAQSLNNSHN